MLLGELKRQVILYNKLLTERFDHFGSGYSKNANYRRDKGINSVRRVLNRSAPRIDTPTIASAQKNPLQTALENVANKAIKLYPDEIKKNNPKLLEWHEKNSK